MSGDDLDAVRTAIRLGCFDEARAMLGDAVDAPGLNLLGILAEQLEDFSAALRYYGRAVRRDRAYAPAGTNLRRLYELYTFGESHEPKLLGDERLALGALLRDADPAAAG